MKPRAPLFRGAAPGFSLIELIGVLAIMAILASVIVPNALHGIDRAAQAAEAQTMANLGQAVISYQHATGTVPASDASNSWAPALAGFANLSPASVATNPRGQGRVYVVDPAYASTHQVLILSNLRAGLDLPSWSEIATTPGAFQAIWNTADGTVPDPSSWAGWSAWSGVAGSGSFLVIARVNLSAQSLTFPLTLNNSSGAIASYSLVLPGGAVQGPVPVAPGPLALPGQVAGAQLNLFSDSAGASLSYSYVVSTTGKTFAFNGTAWTPL